MSPNYGVITICLNAAGTLRRCLDSVLSQTAPPAQYVLVDGGSTDGSLEILREAVTAAPSRWPSTEVGLLQQTAGGGIPAAWNLGLRELRTDVVFILNSDDWYAPDTGAVVLEFFTAHPDADLLATGVRFCTGPDDPGAVIAYPKSFRLFPFLMPVMHPGCFVRRSVYERLGLFDESLSISADYDFVYRCFRSGMRIATLGKSFTSMQIGGRAGRSRPTARRETLQVGLRHSRFALLPWMAYGLRVILGR